MSPGVYFNLGHTVVGSSNIGQQVTAKLIFNIFSHPFLWNGDSTIGCVRLSVYLSA
jgi:hypothetical protein